MDLCLSRLFDHRWDRQGASPWRVRSQSHLAACTCSSRRPFPHRYDLSRISQPYLRELANLRDGSTATTAVKEVGRRLGLRPIDIQQAVSQPRTVAALAESFRRIEEGDVKLRVRTLEVSVSDGP